MLVEVIFVKDSLLNYLCVYVCVCVCVCLTGKLR